MTTSQQEALDARERSLEGVHYALGAGTTIQCIDDWRLNNLIVMTVHRLPPDIQAFVYDNCTFLSLEEGTYGRVLPPGWVPEWTILLNGNAIDLLADENAMSIVAHEIAHAWLAHSLFDMDISQRDAQIETEAINQTIAWGFTGIGATERADWVQPGPPTTFTVTIALAGRDAESVAEQLAGDAAVGALDLGLLNLLKHHLSEIAEDRDCRIVAARLRPTGAEPTL